MMASSVKHRLMSEHWRACLNNLYNMVSVIILLGSVIVDTGLLLPFSSWRILSMVCKFDILAIMPLKSDEVIYIISPSRET